MNATQLFVAMRTGRGLNSREHHMTRSRRVKNERSTVAWELAIHQRHYGKPALPLEVTLTRHAPGRGLDGDNLQGALKAIRDEVARWVGVDDADPRIGFAYGQETDERWGVLIRLEPRRTS